MIPRSSRSCPTSTRTLEEPQKKENRALSRTRVAVEHLIGDLKVFHSLTIKFRNHIQSMADQVILLVAGLCNLKNEHIVQ